MTGHTAPFTDTLCMLRKLMIFLQLNACELQFFCARNVKNSIKNSLWLGNSMRTPGSNSEHQDQTVLHTSQTNGSTTEKRWKHEALRTCNSFHRNRGAGCKRKKKLHYLSPSARDTVTVTITEIFSITEILKTWLLKRHRFSNKP